ncbi:MAG: metal ABC transporter substrate-binding protein [Alcanivoracaceae bacterium]|nr:metal ABC transporter substrate-binding protein [Alcanivoracaceae bacterium]
MQKRTFLVMGWLGVMLSALSQAEPARMPITVVASVEPLSMLVREIYADQVNVKTLLLPNQTPHFAAFTPAQAQQVRDANLLVWLGADAEPNLQALIEKSRGQRLAVLGLAGLTVRYGHHHDDEAHEHHESDLDPHLWLSPDNMLLLARQLVSLAPSLNLNQARAQRAYDAFDKSLASAIGEQKNRLSAVQQQAWLSQHNPWGYLADALALQPPLMISESLQSSTSARRFTMLVQQMKTQSVQCAMAEPEARRPLLERLCHDNCRVVDADPLGRDLTSAHYTDLINHLAQRFLLCLGGLPGPVAPAP